MEVGKQDEEERVPSEGELTWIEDRGLAMVTQLTTRMIE